MAVARRRIGRMLLFGTLPILVMALLAACLAALALFLFVMLVAALPVGILLVSAAIRRPFHLAPPSLRRALGALPGPADDAKKTADLGAGVYLAMLNQGHNRTGRSLTEGRGFERRAV